MRCSSGTPFPCGQCLECLINKRRIWAGRLELESLSHSVSSFVTLTEDKDHEPPDGSVSVLTGQNFLRRLDRHYGFNVRYFLIGEYGDRRGRGHYHAALFGVLPLQSELEAVWGRGGVHVGLLEPDSAAYLTGYATKKWTKLDDRNRPLLNGRNPEFARMSKRPAIGSAWVKHIVDTLTSEHGSLLISRFKDVPTAVNVGSRSIPLGRYLRSQIRNAIFGDPLQPPAAKAYSLELVHAEVMSSLLASPTSRPQDVWSQKASAKKIDDSVVSRVAHNKLASRHSISQSRKSL